MTSKSITSDFGNNLMKINMGQPQPAANQPNANQRGRVIVSRNPVRERVRLDIDGNQIDPRTKRIIKLAKDVT